MRWQKDYVRDYATRVPAWGITGAPLVEGDLLIGLVGGREDAARAMGIDVGRIKLAVYMGVGLLAALIPAVQAYRTDIAARAEEWEKKSVAG